MSKRKPPTLSWRVPDELWERVEPLLPRDRASKRGGRPRADRRRVLDGVLYVLRTGCQWKAAPQEFGSPSTLHNYFQEWTKKGVFFRLWRESLREYDALEGIDWGWQSLDGAMTKAPVGWGKKPAPTRRTAPSPVPSVPFLRMEKGYHSRWRSRAPTCMTCASCRRR